MKKFRVLVTLVALAIASSLGAQQTIKQYLSGTDKDHTVQWDFMVNNGRNSGKWSTIPVPSCWEMQGFGTYSYYQDMANANETGMYKHNFTVAAQNKGKRVFIVFEAAMTEAEVKVNGKSAGPIHQGGFYEFKYDITDLLNYGASNLLEVTVYKKSANNSINRAERQADFWLFGGIFRPVYLEILPPTFIERVAIDAKANGDFRMQVFTGKTTAQTVEAQVYDLKGKAIDKPFTLAANDTMLRHQFKGVQLWNPEQPNLYKVVVSLKEGTKAVHTYEQRFGFRTVELRPLDGFYVNDKKVIFKGVCRHSQWPESGRTLSRDIHLMDIAAMKGMNMNAVRMSHYPPDREFLDLCDSLGLFVLDELTGWQKSYDSTIARKLVKELVTRDVNHPSIVIWDNGNEGGWNRSVDGDYDWYDLQKRHVIHPWERFNGTNTKHYPDFKYVQNEVANAKEVFFPTEFMHGLFDGGHGAGLEDFWNEMMKHPHAAGGFLWALHDEGVVRADRHDSIDVAGNAAPDGIVGPHREKEGSYYTIKELWSPVYIETKTIPADFKGTLEVQNRYLYTNLDKCTFSWRLVRFPAPADRSSTPELIKAGTAVTGSITPGNKGLLNLNLPRNNSADAIYLTALDPKGDSVCTWSWSLKTPSLINSNAMNVLKGKSTTVKDEPQSLAVYTDGITCTFDKQTGMLKKVNNGRADITFNGGPAIGTTQKLLELKHGAQGEQYVVEPIYQGDSLKVKWTFQPGKLPKLEYSYRAADTADFLGVTFNYPEANITGMKYLGRGPYRVWKNRMKGQQFGVWQKEYNNTLTGESWKYPEFKGWHAELYWMQLQNKENNFIVYTDQKDLYLQMLQPEKPKGAGNNNTSPPFAKGNIGFMHAISAIGTKFNKPEVLGPQSQRNVGGGATLKGVLYFDFR